MTWLLPAAIMLIVITGAVIIAWAWMQDPPDQGGE